jgi:putative methyltransferase (TIGR04325 family)
MFTYPYPSWQAACRDQSPDPSEMLDRKEAAVLRMRDVQLAGRFEGIAPKRIMSWPVTACLMLAAARRHGHLRVLDFGGAFGEFYYQNSEFLKHLDSVHWHVVEEPALVERAGRRHATNQLHFHASLAEALGAGAPDLVLLSSVLQYVEDPYALIAECVAQEPPFIAIDRTPVGISVPDVVGIQVIPAAGYDPVLSRDLLIAMRFLNIHRAHGILSGGYRLLDEFPSYFDAAADRPNEYVFRGFIYERKAAPA